MLPIRGVQSFDERAHVGRFGSIVAANSRRRFKLFPPGRCSMRNPKRKLAFVLAACDHGTMIVNRFDYRMVDQDRGFGVGFQILETASFDPAEIDMALSLLDLRRQYFGHGVVALDCG